VPYAPTLTPYLDENPAPRVEVLFNSFASGTTAVTVYRLAQGREFRVRGAVRAATAGSLTRVDNEIPFGIDVTYRAEMFNAAGLSLGYTDSAKIRVNVDSMWVHNPLDPRGAIRAMFRATAARSIARPTEGEVFYPMGRRVGVVIAGQRRGVSEVALDLVVDDVATADAFQAMLGDYASTTVPTLCFRLGSKDRVRLPRPFFAATLDVEEQDQTYAIGGETIAYRVKGDEVSPPAPGLLIPLLTRADLNAYYATRAALKADNLTRLAVNRRYDLAGTA